MDRDVIARKLEQLRHHVARIESKKPFGIEALATDQDLRDVVVFNLIGVQRAGSGRRSDSETSPCTATRLSIWLPCQAHAKKGLRT